jgi:hypothetical protein
VAIRRTTLAAEADDLAVLEGEARRRGTSLARVLGEAIAREAADLRQRNRPRFGVARTEGGAAAAEMQDEDAPRRERRGS